MKRFEPNKNAGAGEAARRTAAVPPQAALAPGVRTTAEPTLSGGDLVITDGEFEIFRELVRAHTGIALSPYKRYLLQARLGKRLRAVGCRSFTEYHRALVEDTTGAELAHFINAITTNKTDFFREEHHFRFLRETWGPLKLTRSRRAGDRTVRFWSAGCSSGEEAYSLAITLLEALGPTGWDLRILASDIDTDVLARGAEGVYAQDQVAPVPPPLVARYFLRGRGADAGSVRVRPEIQRLIAFRRINFLDEPWPIRTRFDGVFCRNVLIYFDRPTQQHILGRLVAFLKDDGLLFLGHSESAQGLLPGLQNVGNTIYQWVGSRLPADTGR